MYIKLNIDYTILHERKNVIFCHSNFPKIFILTFCRILMAFNQWPSPITYVELIFKNRTNSFSFSHIENPIRGYSMNPMSLQGAQCVCVWCVGRGWRGIIMKLSVGRQNVAFSWNLEFRQSWTSAMASKSLWKSCPCNWAATDWGELAISTLDSRVQDTVQCLGEWTRPLSQSLPLTKVWRGRLQGLEAGAPIARSQEADREDADGCS